ncbi:MAG: anhydro-N-acetylmuramic acid kinase [Alphaproteobacteria bacterium]|nr:anhydro-N-acetylmuramic acid kinase [Alphaproteobacteria bacterium]
MTLVIGLMSGTSIDGIDVAAIETDGLRAVAPRGALTIPYAPVLRERIRSVLGGNGQLEATEAELTEAHAKAVGTLIRACELRDVSLIGFHGHTVLHRPWERRTWQIGDGALLARLTGFDVVNDFRSADVASGGQGAPFVPLYHQALAAGLERPRAVINIGGVANVTWLGPNEEEILAFDTGPGNALLDDWALIHTGQPVDEGGALAGTGTADESHVVRFLAHPFFAVPPPKSLDRDDFARFMPAGASPADGATTLAAMTVAGIAAARQHFPAPAKHWLVTGGGRRNPVLMAMLKARLDAPVEPVEKIGWDGDALEAQAFAYLAVRSVKGLPLSLPQTTGVAAPMSGGRLHRAEPRV